MTVYCSFHPESFSHTAEDDCLEISQYTTNPDIEQFEDLNIFSGESDDTLGTYLVFPLPIESPIHGEQSIVSGIDTSLGSPFGWHDTDGIPGPEYTITRGNNVHSFQDMDGDEDSAGDEPDGGDSLQFHYIYDAEIHPDQSLDAVVTNLFYTNNYMHDFAYQFGFTEEAGNFQENNYDNGGDEGDYVIAQALALEKDEEGQQITNNANFATSGDGGLGKMNMFLWNQSAGANRIQIVEPQEIAGQLESAEAQFGAPIGQTPIRAKVVVSDDNISTPTDACQDIVNTAQMQGNIALIDRGICEFGTKVLMAENAGAIAALVCNVAGVNGGTGEELIGGMGAGQDGSDVRIPSLFLKKSDCDIIRMVIDGGNDVVLNLQLINPPSGPSQLSSSLDNGIISHEYAHGISHRLTGGASTTGCLSNDEQMGEGWSDFFSLIVTHKPGDRAGDQRGIGNYVTTGKVEGRGIRRFPYTTDMSLNPLTYNFVRGTTSPHALGEVWAASLWDMYWAFVEIYDFDPDWKDPEAGNMRAVQLVFDGMKFQKCSPGFIDGRDAILAADEALFGGAHQCMIWEVFARRGVGFDAIQGSSRNRNDNEEGFNTLPTCIEELKIEKEASDVIEAGEEILVKVKLANHKKEDLSGVEVTDMLPEGLEFGSNLSEYPVTVENGVVVFDIGEMNTLDELEFEYSLLTDPLVFSERQQFDDFESQSNTLIQFPLQPDNYEWQLVTHDAHSGAQSWFIPNDTTNLDQGLVTAKRFLVEGGIPTLKFTHRYETEYGFDGGFLEVSENNGVNWSPITREKFLKNGYNSTVDFFTFAIPELFVFTGDSGDWITSYVDLSDYLGKEILIRFRFGCDDSSRPSGENKGWYVDDFEILDLQSYVGDETCVTAQEGDEACDQSTTIIEAMNMSTSTSDILAEGWSELLVYPQSGWQLFDRAIE